MKKLVILIVLLSSFTAMAQHPQVVDVTPQHFVYYKFEEYITLLLNSATGEVYITEWNENAAKTKITKCTGGPCEDISQSYDGRFTVSNFLTMSREHIILIDHKLGRLWQSQGDIKKATLIPIEVPY